MKQKIKSSIKIKTASVFFGLLFFVALAGGMAINAPMASAAAPTLTSAIFTDDALKVGETSLVTFTFSEAISGFTNADLTIANGTLTAVATSDNIVWTATFTPTDDLEDAINVITVDMTGVIDVATSTPGVGSTDSSNYAIDTKEPTLTSAIFTDDALKVGETSLVTFTFSEVITGFTNADLTIVNGTLTAVTDLGAGTIWTATFTPTDDLEDATNVIAVAMTGVADTATNTGVGSTDSSNYAIDTKEPTLTSAIFTDDALKVGETSLVTFTFSEVITGFTNADLTIVNGTLTAVTDLGAGTIWTATFTPTDDLEDATNVIAVAMTGVADTATNTGVGSTDSSNYAIDTKEPTVAITTLESDPTSTSPFSVTITFSEAVTTFVVGDITVGNGAAGNFSATSALIYTADITPVANGTVTVDVAGSVAIDTAGNNNIAATQFSIVYDGTTPTVTFSPISGSTGVAVNTTITLTFSEAMRLVAGNAAITNSNAASLITLKKTNASGANVSFTAAINAGKTVITVTPSSNLNNGQLYYVAIGATVEDTADNAITASNTTFTTMGAGSAAPSPVPTSVTGQAAATPANGGVISKTSADGTNAKVVLPAGALIANTVITISPTAKAEAAVSMPLPSGKNIVGGYAYNFTAVSGLNTAVNAFEKALTLTFTYTNEQAEGMNEEALKVYYWDDTSSEWVVLADSEVDTASNIVTATTTHFTYFTVFEGEGGIILPSEIVDGDIIQCQSSSNPFAVYIVKVAGDTKYIRHIVSLDIFNYYSHLKWENLKQVDSLSAYSLSGWARMNTGSDGTSGPNDKVYEINSDQTKHWINMTTEDFLTHGGSDAAIYSVNQGELDLYATGVDVMMLY